MSGSLKYEDAVIKATERYTNKVLGQIYKNIPDTGLRLLKLIEIIPNWETYLTPKQLEVAKQYVMCLNASEVDYRLNLTTGTTQQRLFGSSSCKGAIGRLEEVISRLDKQGYFEKLEKQKQVKNKQTNKPVRPSKLSEKTKEQIRELLTLIVDMPEYESYLTDSQKERVYQFLRLRSIKSCAKYFNVTEITFKQSLLGRNSEDDGGILGRLRKASKEKAVNSWDDI